MAQAPEPKAQAPKPELGNLASLHKAMEQLVGRVDATCALMKLDGLNKTKDSSIHDDVNAFLHGWLDETTMKAFRLKEIHADFALLTRDMKPADARKAVRTFCEKHVSKLYSPIKICSASRIQGESWADWYKRANDTLRKLLIETADTDDKKRIFFRAAEGDDKDAGDANDEKEQPSVAAKPELAKHEKDLLDEIIPLVDWLCEVARIEQPFPSPDSPYSFYALFSDGNYLSRAMQKVLKSLAIQKEHTGLTSLDWFISRCIKDLKVHSHFIIGSPVQQARLQNQDRVSFSVVAHFYMGVFAFYARTIELLPRLQSLRIESEHFSEKYDDQTATGFTVTFLGIKGNGFGKRFFDVPNLFDVALKAPVKFGFMGFYKNGLPNGWGQLELVGGKIYEGQWEMSLWRGSKGASEADIVREASEMRVYTEFLGSYVLAAKQSESIIYHK